MKHEIWTRMSDWHCSAAGVTIDISRMRFPDTFFDSIQDRINRALTDMRALELGEIANKDENRRVGHYWLRSPELAPARQIQTDIESAIAKIKNFAMQVHSGAIRPPTRTRFRKILLIGIGGSALGPQLLADALGTDTDPMTISFLDNTDPDGFARVFDALGKDVAETLSIVISKSGGTVETQNGLLEAIAAYERHGLSFSFHAVAVSQPGSGLDRRATERKWITRFPLWDWVGGRTSLFSAVGMLPAALLGFDIDRLLAGARAMDNATRESNYRHNPALLLSAMWFYIGNGRGEKDMVVLPYKDRLMLLSKYLQQLVMESIGKERDRDGNVVHQGIAVYGNKGSTDQHAYVQQLRDGVPNFFATFVEVLRDTPVGFTQCEVKPGITAGDYLSGFLQGTRRALFENGRDSLTLTIEELTPETIGAIIALFDRAVGFYASMVNINAYHQPGVEAGKRAAEQVIAAQSQILAYLADHTGKEFTSEELAAVLSDAANDPETVYRILMHLSANPDRRIQRSAGSSPKSIRFTMEPPASIELLE